VAEHGKIVGSVVVLGKAFSPEYRINQIADAARALGAHETLRETSQSTIDYWKTFSRDLQAALSAEVEQVLRERDDWKARAGQAASDYLDEMQRREALEARLADLEQLVRDIRAQATRAAWVRATAVEAPPP